MNIDKLTKYEIENLNEKMFTNIDLYEFFRLFYEYKRYYKLVIVITPMQIMYKLRPFENDAHYTMINEIFNEILTDADSYELDDMLEKGIVLYSIGVDLAAIIPSKINNNQYKYLVKLVNQVKKFENDFGIKVEDYYNKESIINDLKLIIDNNIKNDDEILVGESLDSIELTDDEMKK